MGGYHENHSIKNICIFSKSKIIIKVTSKQNLEHFKMINQRLFIHKFCNNSKMLLSSTWAIFIRATSIRDLRVISKYGSGQFGAKRQKLSVGKHDSVDKAVYKWFTSTREQNLPIGGHITREKALDFAKELYITDFKASEGWLDHVEKWT